MQGDRKLGRGAEPVGRELFQRGEYRILDFRRDRMPPRRQRARRFRQYLGDDGLRGGPTERRLAQQHLIGHRAKRIDIASRGDLPLPHRLLGAHVVRGAQRHPGLGHPGAAGTAHGQGDAEVGDEGGAVVEEDVLRLDVAVDDAVAVGVIQRRGNFARDPNRVRNRQLFLPVQPISQRFPFHEGHHVVRGAVYLSRVDQAEDVGVLQSGDGANLSDEPVGADHGGELGPQDFDGDPASVFQVLGEIHGGHAALAQLPLDAVAVGQGGGEALGAHRAPAEPRAIRRASSGTF